MTNQTICYHQRTGIIIGIGTTADGAITNGRFNVGNADIDTSEWDTLPASDDLIEAISCKGGALDWFIKDGVGQFDSIADALDDPNYVGSRHHY
jgi:hypothetical protein